MRAAFSAVALEVATNNARLRGGRALRLLWMPLRLRRLRLRLRMRVTIESRARCRRIKETLISRYRHIQTNIQANTGKYRQI